MDLNSAPMGVVPTYNLDNKNDGFMGGGGMWVFFLFFLLAWGGNGLGGFGGGNAATNQINNDFLYTNLNQSMLRGFDGLGNQHQNIVAGIQGVQQGVCDSTYALKSSIDSCCCNTQRAIDGIGREISDVGCSINRNIDSVRYDMSRGFCDVVNNANYNTRDIIEAGHADTQRIIDKLTQSEVDGLRTQLQSANLALSNLAQTQNIVEQLKPCPSPAYIVPNPFCCPSTPPTTA